jgi:hypothetical protein
MDAVTLAASYWLATLCRCLLRVVRTVRDGLVSPLAPQLAAGSNAGRRCMAAVCSLFGGLLKSGALEGWRRFCVALG